MFHVNLSWKRLMLRFHIHFRERNALKTGQEQVEKGQKHPTVQFGSTLDT